MGLFGFVAPTLAVRVRLYVTRCDRGLRPSRFGAGEGMIARDLAKSARGSSASLFYAPHLMLSDEKRATLQPMESDSNAIQRATAAAHERTGG